MTAALFCISPCSVYRFSAYSHVLYVAVLMGVVMGFTSGLDP